MIPDISVRARLVARCALAIATAATAACGTKEAPSGLQPTGATGRVRFVNLITDTTRGRVNAILEGVPFGVNMTYTNATPSSLAAPSTANYASIYTGNRVLVLKRTADTTNTVATINFTVADGQDRTIYAIGGASGSAVGSLVTTDDNTASAVGQTRLRVVNLSPTAGAVDVFLTAAGADLATATPLVTGLAYQGASSSALATAGTYTLRAVPAGTPAANRNAAVTITLGGITLAGATGRTVVLADRATGGAPLTAFVLTDR
jgi:hypothetical protein